MEGTTQLDKVIPEDIKFQIEAIGKLCDKLNVKVASYTLVYNHEPYLRECLDGIVMQQTDFPYVAIVHDDASTDRSAEMIREYAERYPNLILPIYESTNQYQLPGRPIRRIIQTALAATGCKYVALCEGDDYWTDPLKLQKQVSFLESHPDYSMVYTNFDTVNEYGNQIKDSGRFDGIRKEATSGWIFGKLLLGNFILTCTTVLQRKVYDYAPLQNAPYSLDYNLFLSASCVGKIQYFDQITTNYRIVETGQMKSNGYNVLFICDALQRYYSKLWLSGKVTVPTGVSSLNLKKELVKTFCIQYKHYRNNNEVRSQLKEIFALYPSLYYFIPFGLISVIEETLYNRLHSFFGK